jgi:hypothetical protein
MREDFSDVARVIISNTQICFIKAQHRFQLQSLPAIHKQGGGK